MSSTLAIASITAALKRRLENGLVDRAVTTSIGSEATVSVLPPDRITTGADERAQLNLFLYRVTPNTGVRRLEARSESGERSGTSPLALDLHYLLTAYGSQDYHIEILLGYAVQLLHATPVLPRDAVRTALATDSRGGALSALATTEGTNGVEQVVVSPQFLSSDEMSKIWSSLQTRYRPSVAYKVSLALID